MHKKLILLGMDGATWDVIKPLVSKGQLPNFKELISIGRSGTLISTTPATTAPSWTSMFTGVNPGKHGIVDFLLREQDGFVPCFSRYRMCKSIWQMVSELDKKCIVINDPVTYPPEHVNGIMTTGLFTPEGSQNWIYPDHLKNEIDAQAGGYQCDIPSNFLSILTEDPRAAADIVKELGAKVSRVGRYAAANYDWDLLAIILTTTDRLQHFWWNDEAAISSHYHWLDEMLGEYMELARSKEADLIVVSDHGFGPRNIAFEINSWLEEAGLAAYKRSMASTALAKIGLTKFKIAKTFGEWPVFYRILSPSLQEFFRRVIPEGAESSTVLDTSSTLAYAKTSAGVFVSDNSMRLRLAERLRAVTDKRTGAPIFESVLTREEVLDGPYSYRAPDLLLQAHYGFDISVGESRVKVTRTGIHRPEGIFAYVPHLKSATPLRDPIRPWDVGATILHSLDIPLPDYFDGKPVISVGEST